MTAAFVAGVGVYFAYYIIGPYIDNWLGICTRRDLRFLRGAILGSKRLDEVVAERAGEVRWFARHEGFMWATVCEATTTRGDSYRWEISHSVPRPWLPQQDVYLTPLTRESAVLVPELLPPGFRDVRMIPSSRYAAGVIYDVANPAEASVLHQRWAGRLRLSKLSNNAPDSRN